MKKSLIALAAVAASGAAFAQSSVTLFGVVDTSVAYVDGKNTWTGMQNNGQATSRLGFRGTEDLGGGLKANFWLEGAVQPDDGTAGSNGGFDFKRRATVGVSGNFGEVRLGRELTAAYNAVSRYDVFGDVGFGATQLFGGADSDNRRRSNMVTYLSPEFSGVRFNANYAFGESAEDSSGDSFKKGAYYGFGVTYDNGPLSLGLGVERQNNPSLAATAPEVEGATRLTAAAIGGSYDFGAAKLSAAYRNMKNKPEAGKSQTSDGYMIGVSAPIGAAGVLKASYNRYEIDNGTRTDDKADQYSIGYVHNLSKRTAAYGTYTYVKNKKTNQVDFSIPNSTDVEGYKQGGVQIGVRHAF